jgi:hypothetical protein
VSILDGSPLLDAKTPHIVESWLLDALAIGHVDSVLLPRLAQRQLAIAEKCIASHALSTVLLKNPLAAIVLSDAPGTAGEILSQVASDYFGYCALSHAGAVKLERGGLIATEAVRAALDPVERAMVIFRPERFLAVTNASACFLSCAPGGATQFLPRLYSSSRLRPPTLNPVDYFTSFVRTTLAALFSAESLKLAAGVPEIVGSLAFELFENTHLHALTNRALPAASERGLRSLVMRKLTVTRPTTSTSSIAGFDAADQHVLNEYFAAYGNPHKISLLELIVMDCGEGLAKHFAQEQGDISDPESQLEVVRRCFLKHESSRSGNEIAGVGLYRVARALRRSDAQLRIRTGNLSLITRFKQGSLERPENEPFFVGHRYGRDERKNLAEVVGASFSLLMPLVPSKGTE